MSDDFRIRGVKRLLHLGRRDAIDRTVNDEIDFHIASRVDDLVRQGLAPDEARRVAEREFGDREEAREELARLDHRIEARARRASWRESVAQDVRYAFRSLTRRKVFTAAAIVTIALGVGFTTSVYGIVDGVLLRPLPFHEPERLVQLNQIFTKWKGDPVLNSMWDNIPFGMDEYEKLRDHNSVFESIGVWGGASFPITSGGRTEMVPARMVSASLLNVVGVRLLRGTMWREADGAPGGPKVTVISYEEWQHRYGGADSVIGSIVRLEPDAYQIVGILPPDFRLLLADGPVSYLVPIGQSEFDRGRGNRSYAAIARLKPGITIAHAELDAKRILDEKNKTVRVANWHIEQTRTSRGPLFFLLGAVGLLLAIACINVAMLLLGEASSREHEIAARMALGAGRGRLVQQLLTESLVLSVTGSAIGALLAVWGTKLFVSLAPPRIPGLGGVGVDLRVLGFAASISILTGLLFGLAPSVTLSSLRPSSLIRGAGQSISGRGRLQIALVGSQIGLSVILLVGTGLFAKSLMRLTSTDPGFRADHLIAARVVVPASVAEDTARRRVFFDDAFARLAALPGVTSVTAASSVPFDGSNSSTSLFIPGGLGDVATRGHEVQQRTVMAGYFAFIGTPIVAGRAFTRDDRAGSERVMIVNEAVARREFPTSSALGAQVKFQGVMWTIVGIVGDTRFRRLSVAPEPMVYLPLGQFGSVRTLLVRTSLDPTAMVATVRDVITSLDGRPAVASIQTMDEKVSASFAEERFRTILVSGFGILAALLAAVGMYGVTSRAVHRRTREVGIRVALGATHARVVGLMVRPTIVGAAVGVAAGIAVSLLVAQRASSYLYEVDARDPATYAQIVVFLALIALVASWLPARRAATVHPAAVLRGE